MKKFLSYYFIYRTTKDAVLAAKIYQMIYHPEKNTSIDLTPVKQKFEYVNNTNVETPKVSNKKQEVIDSLNYLKNKPIKTKLDKESIYSLEMVLKNMK